MSAAFIVNPNFEIIRKYYFTNTDSEEYYNLIADFKKIGCRYDSHIALDQTEEEKDEFLKDFTTILNKYNLATHYENLLYISLYLYEKYWDTYASWHQYYDSEKRTVQLAKVVHFLQTISNDKTIDIFFKNGSKKAKVDDKHISNWLKKVILEAVNQANYPLGFGNYSLNTLQGLTPNEFEALSKHKPKNPKVDFNNAVALFCLSLYRFINVETVLKASEGTRFSDAQVNFFFDICSLFKMLSTENISSDPKDYMRSILNQYINKKITA